MKRAISCLLLALFLLQGCSPRAVLPSSAKQRDYWPTEDWRVKAPGEVGLSAEKLAEMDAFVRTDLPWVKSVLVVRGGYLAFEQYYGGAGQEDYHEIQSVFKSYTSALIGLAIEQGLIKGLDQKVLDFFPELEEAGLDPRIKEMTVAHFLTMTSGFGSCPSCGVKMQSPEQDILAQLVVSTPGEKFAYNSPAAYLLWLLVERAVSGNAMDFAMEHLCRPIGIQESCQHGVEHHPRDMARFGYLYLNEGYWDGKQILPAAWVRESTRQHNPGGSPHGTPYGYLWWVTEVEGRPAYFAGGFGGQFIYVVPSLDLVVVITSKTDMHHEENRGIVPRFIVPAVTNGK